MPEDWERSVDEVIVRCVPGSNPSDPDDDLINRGLDSLAVVELLVSLEALLEVEIPDQYVSPAFFRTPGSIKFVVSKVRSESGMATS